MSGDPKPPATGNESGPHPGGLGDGSAAHGSDPTVRMQVTLPGMSPVSLPRPGPPGPDDPAAERPSSLRFVSMKPPSEPGRRKTRLIPAIERPEMKPRLRPLTAGTRAASVPPQGLGRYAPPRIPDASGSRRAIWPYVLLTILAALVGAGITLWALSG